MLRNRLVGNDALALHSNIMFIMRVQATFKNSLDLISLCNVSFHQTKLHGYCFVIRNTHHQPDESTVRRHLKAPQSRHLSRSWPRSNPMVVFEPWVQSICLLFVSWQSDHFDWDIANSIFDLEKSRSMSWPRSNPMIVGLVFYWYVCYSLHRNRAIFGWSHNWPWKSKVMAKIESYNDISGSEFNRCVCLFVCFVCFVAIGPFCA